MLLIQNFTQGNDDLSRAISVVTEEYKYTFWPYGDVFVNPSEEVYHIPTDPFENNNLVDAAGNISAPLDATILAQLRSDYDGFASDWLANAPVEADNYIRIGALFDRSVDFTQKTFAPISRDDYLPNYEEVTGHPYPN